MTVVVVAEQSCKGRSQFPRKRQKFSWLGTGSEGVLEASAVALDFALSSADQCLQGYILLHCRRINSLRGVILKPAGWFLLLTQIFFFPAWLWTHNSSGPQFLLCYDFYLTDILWELNAFYECSFGQWWASFCTLGRKEKAYSLQLKKNISPVTSNFNTASWLMT